MATVKHSTYAETIQSATITLDSVADAAFTSASSAIDNTSTLSLFCDFELVLGSITSLAGGYAGLYILPSVDGSNYPDTPPGETLLAAVFPLVSGASAKRVTVSNVPLPPSLFKLVVGNFSGVSFAGSGNTLKYRRHNITVS